MNRENPLSSRLSALLHMEDASQRKAAANIVRFFLFALVATLIARGSSGAIMAKADIAKPVRQQITETVSGAAAVVADGADGITVPAGLTVAELFVYGGQAVSAGDAMARFGQKELEDKLARERASLEEMNLKLLGLRRGDAHNGSALDAAARNLNRAAADLAEAWSALANLGTALEQARLQSEGAAAAWDAVKDDPACPDDEKTRAQAEAEESRKAYEALSQSYPRDYAGAVQAVQSAERMVEDAQAAKDKSGSDDEAARIQEADQAAQNAIDAKVLEMDIAEQNERIRKLQSIVDSGGVLNAERDARVTKAPEAGKTTDDGWLFETVNEDEGYIAEWTLSRTEAAKLAVGEECRVKTDGGDAYYQPTVSCAVAAIAAPDENDMVLVTLRLPAGDWEAGQTAEVETAAEGRTYDLCVPLSAIRSDSEGYFVLALEERKTVLGIENTARRIAVSVEASGKSMAAIGGLIGKDDAIITGSNKQIEAGDRFRVNVG
jgi:hypothetical protein